jgi:hypothetical protein
LAKAAYILLVSINVSDVTLYFVGIKIVFLEFWALFSTVTSNQSTTNSSKCEASFTGRKYEQYF